MKTMKFYEFVALLRKDIDCFEKEYLVSNPYLKDAELDNDTWCEHLLLHVEAQEKLN